MRKIFRTRYIIGLLIILIAGGLWYRNYQNKTKAPSYETVAVLKENLIQTVDATGRVESENALGLRFEMPGTIEKMYAREGKTVRVGEELASVRLAELNAAVAQAEANLNQKLAGATDEDRKYYAAALNSAKASLDQSKIDAVNSQNDTIVIIQSSMPKLDDSLTQADNILGVDNTTINADFKIYLGVQSPAVFGQAVTDYNLAKKAKVDAKAKIFDLALNGNNVKPAISLMDNSFITMNRLLSDVSDLLKASVANGSFTPAVIDAKKTTIETTRNVLFTQYSLYVNQIQSMTDAENTINLKQAAYDQALANYEGKINPPRTVDLAPLRAALAQAVANRDKAIIHAPINGLITKVNKKIGETVSVADSIIEILVPYYEVKVDIPETDISKIFIGNNVVITLDAFGDEVKFVGKILNIEPGSTEVQDVVYYKVTVSLDDSGKPVKPGMTANVSISAAQKDNALSIPLRSVKTRSDGSKYVRILQNNKLVEKIVTLGLKANEGKVEVLAGLDVGDEVIVAVK